MSDRAANGQMKKKGLFVGGGKNEERAFEIPLRAMPGRFGGVVGISRDNSGNKNGVFVNICSGLGNGRGVRYSQRKRRLI
jgi:hypothetical protein